MSITQLNALIGVEVNEDERQKERLPLNEFMEADVADSEMAGEPGLILDVWNEIN